MNNKRKSRLCIYIVLACSITTYSYYMMPSQVYKQIASENSQSKYSIENTDKSKDDKLKKIWASTAGSNEGYEKLINDLQAVMTENSRGNSVMQYTAPKLDRNRRFWKTWRNSPECSRHVVRFAEQNSLNLCALSSFPGSGNTWLRYLLEAATGIFTGSLYQDNQLSMWGYYGEQEDWTAGTTIVQKSHSYDKKFIEIFNGTGIILVRNPYRAVLAFHNYIFGNHKLYAPMVNYRNKGWPLFVHKKLKNWLEFMIFWVKNGKKIMIIHYENLRKDPTNELRRAMDFLKVPVNEDRLKCLKNTFGTNMKRHDEHFPINMKIFSNVTRDKMDRAIRYVSYLLTKNGHEPLPIHMYEFYNGTSSNKITFVPCREEESTIECDNRIDNLNFNDSFQSRKHQFDASRKSKLHNTDKQKPNFLTIGERIESSALKFMSSILKYATTNSVEEVLRGHLYPQLPEMKHKLIQ